MQTALNYQKIEELKLNSILALISFLYLLKVTPKEKEEEEELRSCENRGKHERVCVRKNLVREEVVGSTPSLVFDP